MVFRSVASFFIAVAAVGLALWAAAAVSAVDAALKSTSSLPASFACAWRFLLNVNAAASEAAQPWSYPGGRVLDADADGTGVWAAAAMTRLCAMILFAAR